MAAARGRATRGWLELRDAVLAWWRVAFVLAPLVLALASARAEAQATKGLTAPGRASLADTEGRRLPLRTPRPAALPPRPDEAIEPPAFGVSTTVDEAGDVAPSEDAADARATPELAPPPIPAPALSLDVPERPALGLPGRAEKVLSEEALLSPAPTTAPISEAPPAPANVSADRSTTPDVAATGDDPPAEVDVLSLIRMEIKQRLPYFEGCARSARRRNGLEVRRMQATWAVAADGSIKSIKVDGIDDPELGACIVRIGSRPFTVHPGAELVIPTPIVFVR